MKGFAVKLFRVDSDIEVFLTKEEINKLETESIKGVLYNPTDMKTEYKAELFLDLNKSNPNITVKKAYDIYLNLNYYERLKKYGWIGTRVLSPIGDLKVDILEEGVAAEDEDFSISIRRIKVFEKEIKPKLKD